ncbi:ubiquitin domain-containing protein UBFD1-like isoform X1 [Branchiostoma floridae x Branchiostoma belcheri]|nr:Ubiquitin domain-containing protein ubfd1 [Branchiostoma belcheri]
MAAQEGDTEMMAEPPAKEESEAPVTQVETNSQTDSQTKQTPDAVDGSPQPHTQEETTTLPDVLSEPKETIDFKVMWNKKKYDITFPLDDTVEMLKKHIHSLTGIPPAMQKLMYKGLAQDQKTLRELKVTKGAKMMVVGSTLDDVVAATTVDKEAIKEEEKKEKSQKESFSSQKLHKKILDKGKPDDVMPGHKGKEKLPTVPLSGMLNKSGGKVRLTFKLELDQLWIGTKDRTDKLPLGSIKAVVSEKIEGQEEYSIMGLQLGPTEASRYWVYWVPSQYVEAIKDAILGKWQYF